NARDGLATLDPSVPGVSLEPLFETILASVPGPRADLEGGFQLLVSNIRYNEYLGRSAVGRVLRGILHRGDALVRIDEEGKLLRQRSVELFAFEGLETVPLAEARAGDIVLLTGLDAVNIGDTIAAADAP